MSTTETPLLPGNWYHIYNRGINGETLFRNEANYQYFLKLVGKYLLRAAKVYAYSLMKNHFHLLVSIHENSEKAAHLYFSNLFNSYAQAFNKQHGRKGGLFERPFKRKVIHSEIYLMQLVWYIHRNPVHHNISNDFRSYPYSSYNSFLSRLPTRLEREQVLDWFGGREEFIAFHRCEQDIVEEIRLE